MSRCFGFLIVFSLAILGCAHQQTRLQSEDESEKEPEVKTVGELTEVANAEGIHVSGVGLVTGLDGTGGPPPNDGFRSRLEDQLRKHGVDHPKKLLDSPNNSLVLVSGFIPAGVHKGDTFDVQISLPPNSRTSSLRGGYLNECYLFNYDSTHNISPEFAGADRLIIGHRLAKVEGPVVVGFDEKGEASKVKQASIWGGAHSEIDRVFYLVLNKENQRVAVAKEIADRINETFPGPTSTTSGEVASAKTNKIIFLAVPRQYQHNIWHYLRVVRLIPLWEKQNNQNHYRRQMEEQLLDPAHSVTASLRLEALGTSSVETLKKGLQSNHVLVRFSAAEALAYLGSPSGAEELAKLVEHQEAVRAYSLTALASLDEGVSRVKLRGLLASSSAETRYGAFWALRALDEHDSAVEGERLNGSFWLHRVPTEGQGLVHISCTRRPEIVLFGEEPVLVPPFQCVAGEFTLTAEGDGKRCCVSRLSVRHGVKRRQCSLKLEEVLRTMAEMGGMYPESVEFLRQADRCRCLSCGVSVDALAQAPSVMELAKRGAADPDFLKDDEEILNARSEFNSTPNLFEKEPEHHRTPGEEKSKEE